MTPDQARIILEDWMSKEKYVVLPIVDEIIYKEPNSDGLNEWSFKGLIAIAYNLK